MNADDIGTDGTLTRPVTECIAIGVRLRLPTPAIAFPRHVIRRSAASSGKPKNVCHDTRKCDIAKSLRTGDADARAIAVLQNLLSRLATCANREDDTPSRQTAGETSLSRRTSPWFSAYGHKLRPGGPMHGAVNPATAEQRGICGVNNRTDLKRVISPVVRRRPP